MSLLANNIYLRPVLARAMTAQPFLKRGFNTTCDLVPAPM